MAQKRIKRLGFDSDICSRFQKYNIHTIQDLLSKSRLELLQSVGLGIQTIDRCMKCAAKSCAPKPVTALSMMTSRKDKMSFLRTTLDKLDTILQGGLPLGTITEISGPSGCGKTQFCIMLSAVATLPLNEGGFGGNVLYIDTESAFSAERLVEILKTRFDDICKSEEQITSLVSNVHVVVESTCSSLLKRLQNLEEYIISRGIKLIVLDSVASLVRKEFHSGDSKNLIERTNLLAKQAALLKFYAESFGIPVIVTNQITTRYGHEKQNVLGSLEFENGYVTAALGNTWSHSVNTRLIVQYLDGPRRQLLVAKSPVAPFTSFVYRIRNIGLQLEDDGIDCYDGTDPGLQKIRVRTDIPQSVY